LPESRFAGKLSLSTHGDWAVFRSSIAFLFPAVFCFYLFGAPPVIAGQIEYPQIIHTQYEAVDQKIGGHFILWSEREKIFYGLDQKLFPGARFVDITQVTPSVGSITLTYVEVRTVGGTTSDYLYLTGNVRFRVSGMALKSSNFPAGGGMTPNNQ
jgi:hypothetical protein